MFLEEQEQRFAYIFKFLIFPLFEALGLGLRHSLPPKAQSIERTAVLSIL